MTRIRAALVLALALAATAALASTAHAEEPQFHAEGYPYAFEGEQGETDALFTVDGQEAKCGSASVSGEITKTSTTLTLIPIFSECTAFGFVGATVTTGSCDFTWHLVSGTTAKTDITCPGTPMKIKSSFLGSTCEVEIGSQEGVEHVVFTNQTKEGTMHLHAVLTGQIAVNKLQDTGICPLSGKGAAKGSAVMTFTIPGLTAF